MTIRNYIIILLLAIFLSACDPGHKITFTFENHSSREVVLISQSFDANKITLAAGETKVVTRSGLGGYDMVNSHDYCPCSETSIQLYTVDTTLKITRDIKSFSNWSRTAKREYVKSGEFTCKFTLTDQDIQ